MSIPTSALSTGSVASHSFPSRQHHSPATSSPAVSSSSAQRDVYTPSSNVGKAPNPNTQLQDAVNAVFENPGQSSAELDRSLKHLEDLTRQDEIDMYSIYNTPTQGLCQAATHYHIEKIQQLLSTGLHINAQDEEGNTALHWAASGLVDDSDQDERNDAITAIQLLRAQEGIDTRIGNNRGITAYDYALVNPSLNFIDREELKKLFT
jgi:hypothetical protein